MGTREIVSLLLAGLMIVAPVVSRAQGTALVASTTADANGNCVVDVPVDPGADPQIVADALKEHLLFSGGAQPQLISVENGVAHVECAGAAPDSGVELWLPSEIAESIGARGEVPDGGVSKLAIAGGILLGLAGLGLGICAAMGCFDDHEEPRTVTGVP